MAKRAPRKATADTKRKAVAKPAAKRNTVSKPEPAPPCAPLAEYRKNYIKTKSATGRSTQNNGDDVAGVLANYTPNQVMTIGDTVLGLDVGSMADRYAHLNLGQARMCTGNRIRALIKSGECTLDDLVSAAETISRED